jgi:hypothetical protein
VKPLVLVLALSLVGCATQKVPIYSVDEYLATRPIEVQRHEPAPVVRDDAPEDTGSGGGWATLPPLQLQIFGQSGPIVTGSTSTPAYASTISATSITLSAASGANGVSLSTNGARADFGSGASDYLNSDGTKIITPGNFQALGLLASDPNSSIYINGIQVAASTFWQWSAAGSLATCASGVEGRIQRDSTGGTGAVYTKLCACRFDGTTYKWFNMFNPSVTTGTTTTCPN